MVLYTIMAYEDKHPEENRKEPDTSPAQAKSEFDAAADQALGFSEPFTPKPPRPPIPHPPVYDPLDKAVLAAAAEVVDSPLLHVEKGMRALDDKLFPPSSEELRRQARRRKLRGIGVIATAGAVVGGGVTNGIHDYAEAHTYQPVYTGEAVVTQGGTTIGAVQEAVEDYFDSKGVDSQISPADINQASFDAQALLKQLTHEKYVQPGTTYRVTILEADAGYKLAVVPEINGKSVGD